MERHRGDTRINLRNTRCKVGIAAAFIVCCSGTKAWAQTVRAAVGTQNQASRLSVLQTGLDSAVWDPAQRGPLIAVAPQSVRPAVRRKLPPQVPERLPGGRYRVADLAQFFGRRLVRLAGVTVLAPTEMVVLNTKPGKPDYFAGMPQVIKMRMLQATLTPAQWKLLGGDSGLGAGDLSGVQRDLFLSCLPSPMVLRKQQVTGQGSLSAIPGSKAVIVPESRRGTVRLRLSRIARFSVPLKTGGGIGSSRYTISREPAGTEVTTLEPGSGDRPPSDEDEDSSSGAMLYGQRIRTVVPSRLKPQQIDFSAAALQAPVSLAGIKTVGELIERVRKTTRTEIYVDGRAAKLALWIRAGETQTVRAGDALQALCWSLAGAVRFVDAPSAGDREGRREGVFLLTQDLEGIGSRVTRIRNWFLTARNKTAEDQGALLEAIRKQRPLQYIGFGPDDPNALDAKTNKRAEDAWKSDNGRSDGAKVTLSDLPPSQQNAIRSAMADYAKQAERAGGKQKDLADNGTVYVFLGTRASLLVPGIGAVQTSGVEGSSGDMSGMLPLAEKINPEDPDPAPVPQPADTARIPSKLPLGGVLCVSPVTDEEARKAVQAARERGLKQVWLVLPLLPAAEGSEAAITKSWALLAAAIGEAQSAKPTLRIVAGVRLFRLPSVSEGEPFPADRSISEITITGELPGEAAQRRAADAAAAEADPAFSLYLLQNTHNWAAPGTEGLARRLSDALVKIAETPGLAGMALLDTAPTGYSLSGTASTFDPLTDTIDVGYTAASRIAFIRSAGCDPIDLVPGRNSSSSSLTLPFFEEDDRLQSAQWNRFRADIVSKTLSETHALLRSSIARASLARGGDSGFPVFLQNLDAGVPGRSAGLDWFSRWDKSDALPRRSPKVPGRPYNIFRDAQAASPVSLLDVGDRDFAPRAEPMAPSVLYARSVNSLLGQMTAPWPGVVFNLSGVPLKKALEQMEGIVPAPKASLP